MRKQLIAITHRHGEFLFLASQKIEAGNEQVIILVIGRHEAISKHPGLLRYRSQ